jgi:four helix bundle protein
MEIKKEGFRKLITWQKAALLRKRVYDVSKRFSYMERRRVEQMNAASRSVKQNIQEGYYKTIGQYIYFPERVVLPSLKEVQGDIDDCLEDKLITEEEFKELDEICGKLEYLLRRQIAGLKNKRQKDTKK